MKQLFLCAFLLVTGLGSAAHALDLRDISRGINMYPGAPGQNPGYPGQFPGRPPRPPRPPGPPGYPGNPGYPPPPPSYGRYECVSTDKGWEEHRGAHYSCQECLSLHGNCTETCTQINELFRCEYVARNANGGTETFIGEDPDRRWAEQRAMDSCYRAGYQDCRYQACNSRSDNRVVSRRSCPR